MLANAVSVPRRRSKTLVYCGAFVHRDVGRQKGQVSRIEAKTYRLIIPRAQKNPWPRAIANLAVVVWLGKACSCCRKAVAEIICRWQRYGRSELWVR